MSDPFASSYAMRLHLGARQAARLVLRGEGTVPAFAQTFAAQVLVLALNVATGVFTARILGPEGRGIFTAVTLWPQFMATLMLLGLQNAVVYYMRQSPALSNSVLTAGLAMGLVLSAVGALAGVLIIPSTMHGAYAHDVISFAVSATAIITGINLMTMLLRQAFVAFGAVGASNKSAWTTPLLYLGLLVGAWSVLPMGAQRAALCQFAAAVLILGWMLIRLARLYTPDFSGFGQRCHMLASYMGRAAPGEAMSVLAANLDRLVLVPFIPAAELGLYAVAYSLSRLLTVIQAALTPVALPAMAGRTPLEAKLLHDRLFRFTLYGVVVIAGAAFIFGGLALHVFYGNAFAPAADLFRILVVEAALSCLSFLPAQLYMSLARPGFLSVIQVASFAVTLAALLLLVPTYGATGAAVGMLLSAIVRLSMLLAGLRTQLGLKWPRLLPEPGEFARVLSGFREP